MKRFVAILLLALLLVQAPLTAFAAIGESELALQQVAQRYKSNRILGGCILMGAGGLLIVNDPENDPEGFTTLVGGVLAGAGVLTLLLKSPAEREYGQVVKVQDPIQREKMAYESLAYLADTAKRNRIFGGISNGVLAIYFFTSEPSDPSLYSKDDYKYLGLLTAGASLGSFLLPSYEEKVFAEVKQAKERQYALDLAPIGDSIGVRLTYNFK
ncbi:MAG: hypothetical protein GX058_03800 [Firmicutes bacterium]|nr:hypothetical protein [Bacillota bacterium]